MPDYYKVGKNKFFNMLSRSSFIRLASLALFSGIATTMCDRTKAGNKLESTLKASRLKTLSKGYNLDRFQKNQLTTEAYTEALLQQYKAVGLTYTRLPIVLSAFLDNKNPDVLKTDSLATLDEIIQMHIKAGLGIVLCPFEPPPELYFDPTVFDKYLAFSKAFATHLNKTDPEKVFLQVVNEPIALTPQAWDKLQLKLIPAIRSGAPNHTIIASSNLRVKANDWSNVRALPMTNIVEDKNVVYDFHFYEPFVFTHQGATWGWKPWQFMKDIPYPSTPEAVAPLLNGIQDTEARLAVENYGKENWNRTKFTLTLAKIADWAKVNKVSVICTEFGAIPWTAPKDSRLVYLKDVREVLETYKIGWGLWFGLELDDLELMQALGLTPLPRT